MLANGTIKPEKEWENWNKVQMALPEGVTGDLVEFYYCKHLCI